MDQKQEKIYFPIFFLECWLLFTVLVFTYGPYSYKISKPFVFYTYLVAVQVALLFGYIRGQRSLGRALRIKIDYYRFVKITVLISLFYFVVKILFTFGGDLRNFSDTFRNAHKTYLTSSLKHANLFSYLDMIFAPISLIAITNTIYSYKTLPGHYRYSVYILILFSIASSIGSATRSGIVQTSIIIVAAVSLGIYKKTIILKYYHKLILIILAAGCIIGFFIYSALLTNTRGGKITNNPLTNEPPRKDFFLNKIVSPKVQPVINNVSFYVSHSYYRLNKAMNLPFKGIGFGLSNSYFVMDNIESLTGWSGLKNISYGVRLDKGIGRGYGLYWSTFYTWIASDFTFPGTLIVIFFIGYLCSIALKDSFFYLNPFSVTVFCILFYFIFHFAFNNPMQDGRGITTNLFLPILWLIFRQKNR